MNPDSKNDFLMIENDKDAKTILRDGMILFI